MTALEERPAKLRRYPAIVNEIVDQLQPLIARQRRAVAEQGCLRNISSTQLHVLFVLVSEGGMPMSRLAEQLGVTLPNATGIVERMVDHGFVERVGDEDDRRIVKVRATDAGRATVEEIDMIRRGQIAAVVSKLTAIQQQRALRTFTELRQAAEALEFEAE